MWYCLGMVSVMRVYWIRWKEGNASSLGLFENGLLYQANVHAGLQCVMRIRGRRNQSYSLSWGRSGQ